ncbi:MAG: DUF1629 domain-containing protein [Pseudomonadota bacterium]
MEIAALPLSVPYPEDAPLRACEGNLFWPKAAEVVRAHRSHVALVASHPGEGWEARRAEMLKLLDVAEEVAGNVGATAVYCPNGVCVAPITRMTEALRAARAGDWLNWTTEPFVSIRCIDQREAPGGESDATFLSAGAAAFFGHEVAVRMTGRAGVPHAVTLFALRHLMANGPVFKDGDAVPIPAGPVLTVREIAEGNARTLTLQDEGATLAKPAAPAVKRGRGAKPKIWMNGWNFDAAFTEYVNWQDDSGLELEDRVKLQRKYLAGDVTDVNELPTRGYYERAGNRDFPDVGRNASFLLASEKTKAVFERFNLGASRFTPFKIYKKDNVTPLADFYIFNLVEKKAGIVMQEPDVEAVEGFYTHMLTLDRQRDGGVSIHGSALEGPDVWLDSQIMPTAVFYSDRLYRACREAKLRKMTFKKTILVEE